MAKFRKKPVEIEAVQFDGTPSGANAVFDEFNIAEAKFVPSPNSLEFGCLMIPTLEGTHRADPGDWIIRGVEGEFYPCKPSIFAATYEPVEAAGQAKLPL